MGLFAKLHLRQTSPTLGTQLPVPKLLGTSEVWVWAHSQLQRESSTASDDHLCSRW